MLRTGAPPHGVGPARKRIIVATGSQPRSVPGIEIDRKRIITSDAAIGLTQIPQSIVILGKHAHALFADFRDGNLS